MQDRKGEFSLELTLSNLHPTHTAFWVHLTLLRATKGPDEPHALHGASCPPEQSSSPAHSSAACTQGTAGRSPQMCEPLRVGHDLERKLRWVRVLPVFWSDNYLTIPPLDTGPIQVQPVDWQGACVRCRVAQGRLRRIAGEHKLLSKHAHLV